MVGLIRSPEPLSNCSVWLGFLGGNEGECDFKVIELHVDSKVVVQH